MFQKPTFGSTTSGFGSFNATPSTSSPFGGFKPQATTSAFGAAPAFGASAAPQPAQTGSFFGAPAANTSGLFGSTAPAASSSFGAPASSGFGFGGGAGGGLFGGQAAGGGLFGTPQQQTTSAFGAKPAGFGFGSTPAAATASTGVFGAAAPAPSLFAPAQNTAMGGGGLFSNTAGAFGATTAARGTAHVKYNPVVGTDVMVKSGTSQNINIKHHCITCMKEYESKSLEELRLEDYLAGNKGAPAAAGVFGAAKPLFGGSTAFGQPATTAAQPTSVFGGGGFGQTTMGQNSTFAFGASTQPTNSSTNLFGANKPAFGATATPGTTGLFGAATTQAPAFGATNTSTSFGFGANTQNQSTGLFGAKPATTGFGAPAASGFGSFSSGGLFANKPATATAQPAPAFGAAAPAFGAPTSTAGSLFGNSAFGKPAQPSFGFGSQPATGLGGGLGGGLGATSFQAKPGGGFPSLNTSAPSLFGGQANTTLNFNTGGSTGLGGGLGGGLNFGNTSTLGNPSLGLGNTNPMGGMANTTFQSSSSGANVHEQILTLAARPYGDWPLFKDLVPEPTTSAEDVLKPTNPAAVKAVLDSSGYRVTSPDSSRLKLHPRTNHHDKKSLFDGLEESDASLEDKLSLKPSRKRLVLRPQQSRNVEENNSSAPGHTASPGHRSLEDASLTKEPSGATERPTSASETQEQRAKPFEDVRGINTDLEESSERHNSWLSSSKLPWNDSKEKPVDNQPTPRLYPDLAAEQLAESDRRASWLTTKPLRKKSTASEPDDRSVRELRTERGGDKENEERLSVSEEENVSPRECPPHPTGVKLTRPGYYTVPSLDDMISYIRPDGRCVVPHLTIGRTNYGNVYYDGDIDVTGLDLDALVHFLNKEVMIYPSDADKPPVGEGLNRRAVVTLDRVWPTDRTERRAVTDPNRLLKMDYEGKLRRVCEKHNTKFIEYRPATGSWVFRVEHFSKYGITDSDEEDDITPEVMKRQLVTESLQKNAAPAQKPLPPAPGLGGLGGLGGLAAPGDSLFQMQQSTLNLLNGAGKAFEMDTTEDNDIPSLYPEINRAYGVKSPTSELARLENRHSHSVQLMKASLYADTEMEEDDMSVSTGDQLVPVPPVLLAVSPRAPPPAREPDAGEGAPPAPCEEVELRPLDVRPHTIVLKYHRKVPPFKLTIAGELGASCIADMSICRARHSRVGHGPANTLVHATSAAASELPPVADLSQLGDYVAGRGENDWSEAVVNRIAIGQSAPGRNLKDELSAPLDILLDFSTFKSEDSRQLVVRDSPADRRELLRKLSQAFAGSNPYRQEVWQLCEALWGADLDNDGVPGTDPQSIVDRHNALLQWLLARGVDVTAPADDKNSHTAQIYTLLLGGRLLEACKLARESGDLNMAAILAQAGGDAAFRSLLSTQIQSWRASGADSLLCDMRLRTLETLCARAAPRGRHWLHALGATARYICPQVSSLEQIIRKYSSMFAVDSADDSEDVDLTVVREENSDMLYPLPPYQDSYAVGVTQNGKKRRVLDLRYELIRARAFHERPKLQPAAHTPDPLDYSLCFLLGAWFGCPSAESITGYSQQLEAAGAWQHAAAALAYLSRDTIRSRLIRDVLSRNAPSSLPEAANQKVTSLLQRLRVPVEWLREAQAARAKYEHKPKLEAEHLLAAGHYNESHRVLLDELLPATVLADEVDSIAHILEQLNEAAKQHKVHGWDKGGAALYHYLHVCTQIRELASTPASQRPLAVESGLEALRPRVAAACRALAPLQPKTPAQCAALTELGGRLVAWGAARALAAALAQLRLPPHATHQPMLKLITELAEQASEACAESASDMLPRRGAQEISS